MNGPGIFSVNDLSEEQLEGLQLIDPREDFDHCLVGVVVRFNDRFALYSRRCVIEQLAKDMIPEYGSLSSPSYMDAVEFFNYNVIGAWIGDTTPAFLEDDGE